MLRAKESWASQATEGHWFLSNVGSHVEEGVVPQSHGVTGSCDSLRVLSAVTENPLRTGF